MATMETMQMPREKRNYVITLGITHKPFDSAESVEVLMQGYGIWEAVEVVLGKARLDYPAAHKIIVIGHRDATEEYPVNVYTAEVIDRGFLDELSLNLPCPPNVPSDQPSDLAISVVGKIIADKAASEASAFVISRRKNP